MSQARKDKKVEELEATSQDQTPSEDTGTVQSEGVEEAVSLSAPVNYTARKMAVAALAGSALLFLTVITGVFDPTDILL